MVGGEARPRRVHVPPPPPDWFGKSPQAFHSIVQHMKMMRAAQSRVNNQDGTSRISRVRHSHHSAIGHGGLAQSRASPLVRRPNGRRLRMHVDPGRLRAWLRMCAHPGRAGPPRP